MKKNIKTLAALLMAGAAFTACSSSDDNIIEQTQNPTEPKVYTLVIKASKGGDATTRALKPGYDEEESKNTVDAYWTGTEKIEVGQYNSSYEYKKIGEATADPSPDGETIITATLNDDFDPDKDLNFYLGGHTLDYTGQVGLLTGTNSISEKYDYATDCLYSGSYTVDDINNQVIPNINNSEILTFGGARQAIIKFTLKDKANNEAISPSAFTVSDGTSTVSLTDIPATTYSNSNNGDGVLYVAFPASGYDRTITLTATVGDDTYTYTTSSAKTFWCGEYYEITVKMTKQANVPEGAINGKFTINGSGNQVYFSKGNLQATTTNKGTSWSWAFAANQWDYIGSAASNTSINGNGSVSTNGTVDLFGWVGASSEWTGAAIYGISNSKEIDETDGYGDKSSENLKSDWGNTIGTGWRTPTKDEWVYLFSTRTAGGTVGSTAQARYTQATINTDVTGVKGMILFPDGVDFTASEFTTLGTVNGKSDWGTKCTSAQWTALAAKGCVFLPAAGERKGSTVSNADLYGAYWSSSPYEVDGAFLVRFFSNSLAPNLTNDRYMGYSVRLVRAVE